MQRSGDNDHDPRGRTKTLLSLMFAPIVIAIVLSPTLVGHQRVAFRDVSHFYLPLYDYVDQRCSSEWLPLWNSHDQTGLPLLGECTTAVMYPVRWLVYSMPIENDLAMNWYLAVHLVIAAMGGWYLVRCTGASRMAGALSALTYSLSGSVYSLLCNPPFLVGAAWLPLMLAVIIAAVRLPTRTRIGIAAVAIAMMVLGGDPQTALHACMFCTVVLLVRWFRRNQNDVGSIHESLNIKVFVFSILLGALLCAPQIAASIDWSLQSDRVKLSDSGNWLVPPLPGSARSESMEFSIAPWHVAELVTHHPFGPLFPENRRVSVLIPGDGRMWAPTIYMSVLAVVAWLVRISQWRQRGIEIWSVTALVSLLLCAGHFGLVWILQQFTDRLDDVDSAAGGPYWFLYQFIPGYDSFRYPAKWLPLFALSISILAGRWFDRVRNFRTTQAASLRWMLVVTVAVGIGLAAVLSLQWWGRNWLAGLPGSRDFFWGPLDPVGSLAIVRRSLIQSLVVCSMLYFAIRVFSRDNCRSAPEQMQFTSLVVLVLVAIDLGQCCWSALPRVEMAVEKSLAESAAGSNQRSAVRWLRMQNGGWPDDWKIQSSIDRATEVAASERAAWFGRWHLADNQAVFNNMVSIRSKYVDAFWSAAYARLKGQPEVKTDEFWKSVRRWIEIDGVTHSGRGSFLAKENGTEYQLVSITNQVEPVRPGLRVAATWRVDREANAQANLRGIVDRVIRSGGEPIPTIVSRSAPAPPAESLVSTMPLVGSDPNGDIVMAAGRTLCTRVTLQDGNWHALIRDLETKNAESIPLPVYNVDGLKQGCIVPAGNWRIKFVYQPSWLRLTVIVMWIGWCLSLLIWFLDIQKSRSTPAGRG